jgi:hypothetical protein
MSNKQFGSVVAAIGLLTTTFLNCGDVPKPTERTAIVQQLLNYTVPPSNGGMLLVAGTGVAGRSDHANPLAATFNDPSAGLASAPAHLPPNPVQYLVVADWGNNAIRYVSSEGVTTGWSWFPNLLLNSRAETLSVATPVQNWIGMSGNWALSSGCSGCGESAGGNRYFYPGVVSTARLYQDVDVTAKASQIDAGNQKFCFTGMLRSLQKATPDATRIKLDSIKADGNYATGGVLDTGEMLLTNGWTPIELEWTAPALTRTVRVNLISRRRDCSTCSNDAFYDELQLVAGSCHGMMLPQALARAPRLTFGGRDLCHLDPTTGQYLCSAAYSKLYVRALAVGSGRLYVASATKGLGYVAIDAQGVMSGAFQPLLDQNTQPLGVASGVSVEKLPGRVDRVSFTLPATGVTHPVQIYDCQSSMNRCDPVSDSGHNVGFLDATSGAVGGEAFLRPRGLATGRFGDLFLADIGNHAVRRVLNQFVVTVGGTGLAGNSGSGGPARAALINEPSNPSLSPNGDIYFADRGNNQIKRIVCATNSICSQVEQFNAASATCDVSPAYPSDDKNSCTSDPQAVRSTTRSTPSVVASRAA